MAEGAHDRNLDVMGLSHATIPFLPLLSETEED